MIKAVGEAVETWRNPKFLYLNEEGLYQAIKRARAAAVHRCKITVMKIGVHKKLPFTIRGGQ